MKTEIKRFADDLEVIRLPGETFTAYMDRKEYYARIMREQRKLYIQAEVAEAPRPFSYPSRSGHAGHRHS